MTVETYIPSFLRELPQAGAAAEYATWLHRGQRRDSDDAPFILHPFEVASLLSNTGHPDAVVAAGVLHEAMEDGGADYADISARFGRDIADVVRALSEDRAIASFDERKAALRRQIADFGGSALAVDAADKVAKVRELRIRAHDDPAFVTAPEGVLKIRHYQATLELLEQRDAAPPLTRQLRFELEALALQPGL
jgi:(p)ppGpp synthase/HD superfamily hydrolase